MSSENKVNKNSQIYGNKQIIEFFFKKYNVLKVLLKNVHPININKKILIYTNSSTIVLEIYVMVTNLFSLAQDTIVSLVLKLSLKMSGKNI